MTKPRKLQTIVQVVGSLGEVAMFFMGYLAGLQVWWAMGLMLVARVLIKIITSELMYRRQRANLEEFTQ